MIIFGVKMGKPLDESCPDVPMTLGGLFYELGRRGVALRCDGESIRFSYLRGTDEEVGDDLILLMKRNKPRIMAAYQELLD